MASGAGHGDPGADSHLGGPNSLAAAAYISFNLRARLSRALEIKIKISVVGLPQEPRHYRGRWR